MANQKPSQLTDGTPLQVGDLIKVSRPDGEGHLDRRVTFSGEFIKGSVKDFGAKGNALRLAAGGAVTASATAYTNATAAFTSADVGKRIVVAGAGAAAAPLITTIAAYVSPTAVTLTDAAGTTVTDAVTTYGTVDNAAFQAAADAMDDGNVSYIFIPNYDETYLLTAAITVTYPDIRIFGFKGAGYQFFFTKGPLRKGNILVGGDAPYAFDLGAEALWPHPTGQWNISNIGIRQDPGVVGRTKHGIAFTSKHNGPHRGAIIRDCSGVGLLSPVFIRDPLAETALANLVVENCCFNYNTYALLSEGNVLGLRFVGNQAEGNVQGAIHGMFSSGIYIADNMFEAQPNTINIIPASVGNRPKIVIERNYFEANTGQYVIKVQSSSNDCFLSVRDNYGWNMTGVDDYVLVSGAQTWFVEMLDNWPITHTSGAALLYGSRFLEMRSFFELRGSSTMAAQFSHAIKDFQNLIDTDETHEHVTFTTGTQKATPFGLQYVREDDALIDIPLASAVGDLIAVNVLCKIGDEAVTPTLLNQADATISTGFESNLRLNGRWCLIAFGLRITATGGSALKFRLAGSTTAVIAGVAARNYGAITTDSSTKIAIYPVSPNL